MLIVVVALGKEIRNRNSAQAMAVTPNPFCNKPPVQICTYRKPDCRPNRFGQAAEQCHSGQAHQQVRAHVRCLGTHGSNQRAKLSPTQIEIFGGTVFSGVHRPQDNHSAKIDKNGCHYKIIIGLHCSFPSPLDGGIIAFPKIDCNTE